MAQTGNQGLRELRKCLLYVKTNDHLEFVTDMYELGNNQYVVNDHGKYMVGTPMEIATYFLSNEVELLSGLVELGANVGGVLDELKNTLMGMTSDKFIILCEEYE